MLRRACDDGAEHVCGVARPPRQIQRHGEDSQVFALEDAVLQLTVDRQGLLRFPDRELGLMLGHTDLGPSRQGLGLEPPVVQPLGVAHRRVGGLQRMVQAPLLPVGDPEIVPRLGDAPVVTGLLVRRDRTGVGAHRAGVVPLHVGDDAEVVGAPAHGGHVVVLHRLLLRAREEIRRLVDAAALQGDRPGDIERPHFQGPISQHAGPQLRDHGPLLTQVQPAEPAVRDAAQQGEHGRLLQLLLGARAQVAEQVAVAPRVGQLLRHMERRERAAQLGREVGLPALPGQMADFALGAEAAEGGLGAARGGLCVGAAAGPAQHDREVARRLGQEL